MTPEEFTKSVIDIIDTAYREWSEERGLKPAIGYLRPGPLGAVAEDSLEEVAEDAGYYIIEWVIDRNTTGSVSPFQRAALAPWLGDSPPHPFNAIVAHHTRLCRKVEHLRELLKWAEEKGVEIIEVDSTN